MNIFVTGGTGFLGSSLVKRLIEESHNVFVLVRSIKKAEALLARLESHEKDFLHIVEGDLSLEGAGVAENDLTRLIGKIDVFYHSAAYLSFDENEREKLFHINVGGTKNVLELAEALQVKKFIHVSTAYTLGNRNNGVEALYPLEETTFLNAYEESKCTAEHTVMSYQDVFDVVIMRPGIIIGDSRTGEADTTFGLYGILKAVELLKRRTMRMAQPRLENYRLMMDQHTKSNLIPVDYVTNLLMLGLDYGEKNTVYNLTNHMPPSNDSIMKMIREVFDFPTIELISPDKAGELTQEEVKINQALAIFKDYLNRTITFDDKNTRKLLEQAGLPILNMDGQMLRTIIEGFLTRKQLITN
ncbi:SDR family oxidoreductase [Bacillus shivajii]|uniref:SDR family oxidoreductase n=1 Tax=Bacillus shivajii TaxID=1983719 RepID=UPI001CFA2929|nr:SDR family oxidoreductase [Bacillus shivajii]UCZ52744.1 SDR family oxidoreductase [Bacillus shivajii]